MGRLFEVSMSLLRRKQVDEFFDVGFTRIDGLFSSSEISEMLEAFERLERKAKRLERTGMYRGSQFVVERNGGPDARIQRIVWCGAAEPVLSAYGMDSRLLRMASVLLGSWEMHQLINQAHFKLPGDAVEFPWHQDSSHRRYGGPEWRDLNGRGSYVQIVLALDDVTADNGPISFVPGSGKLGHLGLLNGDDLPPGLIDESRVVTPTLRAGSALLFGPYTLHRSSPNQSSAPRRVFINGFAYPGANSRVYPGAGAGRLVRLGNGRPALVARGRRPKTLARPDLRVATLPYYRQA
jgi:ectoine hydroxylase-related dioxygenase (phytanoyl-CoA dioxygenase family)